MVWQRKIVLLFVYSEPRSKGILNSIDFYKRIFLHVIPACIIVAWYNSHNPKGIKLKTKLRFGLSRLREPKFKHSFQDSINPLSYLHDVTVVTKLNLQFIFYSTVLCSQTKEALSLGLYVI